MSCHHHIHSKQHIDNRTQHGCNVPRHKQEGDGFDDRIKTTLLLKHACKTSQTDIGTYTIMLVHSYKLKQTHQIIGEFKNGEPAWHAGQKLTCVVVPQLVGENGDIANSPITGKKN